MLKHFLTIAFRNIWRHKSVSAINLISLTAGLVGALLIGLWIRDELQIDKFHSNDEQLYQVLLFWDYGETNSTSEYTQGPMAAELMAQIPEVEAATNISPAFTSFNFQVGTESFNTTGFYVGDSFFDVFDFKLLEGKSEEVLQQSNAVVISERTAINWFGSTKDVIGKVAKLEGEDNMVVSGVFENPPAQSTLQFDCLMSYQKLIDFQPNRDSWNSVSFYTMITLNENANPETVSKKINQLASSNFDEAVDFTAFLRPFSDAYLYGKYENGQVVGGRIEYVRLFGIIGIFLLLIACINFMNLATAQAARRFKEVGVKKTLGSKRGHLILQYLSESLSMAALSSVVAISIVWLVLPAFNNLTEKAITLNISPIFLLALLGLTAIIGLLAGSYPAFYISSFQPLKILKGISNSDKGTASIRRILVVFQFAIAIVLMVGVVVVYQQIQYVQSKNLGYEKDDLIEFLLVLEDRERINTFVAEAKNIVGVENVSSGHTPIN
ncbi:MAG: ABC transporter permease, partial [Bacteroidota bacterium]